MTRGDLSNEQWQRLQPLLPAQKPRTGKPNHDHRIVINGILWILRTGAPWRDLPERYGKWESVATRFYRWQKAGIWQQILENLQAIALQAGKTRLAGSLCGWNSDTCSPTRRGWKKRGEEDEALGRSRGGFSYINTHTL